MRDHCRALRSKLRYLIQESTMHNRRDLVESCSNKILRSKHSRLNFEFVDTAENRPVKVSPSGPQHQELQVAALEYAARVHELPADPPHRDAAAEQPRRALGPAALLDARDVTDKEWIGEKKTLINSSIKSPHFLEARSRLHRRLR